MNKNAIVLLSGGLDSSTCAFEARKEGFNVYALTIDYGQRARKEIDAAKLVAKSLSVVEHVVINLDLRAWGGSALTDDSIDVPINGIDLSRIPPTYVPARNLIFLSLTVAWAEVIHASAIFIGVNSLDYSGYPDARPEFIEAFKNVIDVGTVGGRQIEIIAPLQFLTKKEIVEKAVALGVPIDITWSCYQNGLIPCGVCDPCRFRNDALVSAGVNNEDRRNNERQ